MEMLALSELDHQEQEIDEKGLSQVTGGLNIRNVIATRQQYGKAFGALIGVGLVATLVPSPGEKPVWEH
jgi:hypothetical protein